MDEVSSPFLRLLKNRINLDQIPFTERGSRILVFRIDGMLSVRLAERWFKQAQQLSSYRNRPPIIDRWRFTNAEGQPLEMAFTTYPHRVDCHSSLGTFNLAFLDSETLLLTIPPVRCGISFRAHVDHAQTDRRGGVLKLTGEIRRSIAYTTNAAILANTVEDDGQQAEKVSLILDGSRANSGKGAALLINITPRLGFNRYIPEPAAALENAARLWDAWFAAVPQVLPEFEAQYYFAWWIMRAGLVSTRFYTTREAMMPSKLHYVGFWQWDSYFHALAYRYIDTHLAEDQLRLLIDHQREDGMIPDAVHDEGVVTHLTFPVEADVTKPPLLAWAAWKLYQQSGDLEFLDEVYEAVCRWNEWWFEKNDLDGNGLCEYQHPFSSGLDDSPLWDGGMPVESPDLNTYLVLQEEALADMARLLGEEAEAEMWNRRCDSLIERLIRYQWDPRVGVFWANRNGKHVDVLTPFNLFPLITGRLPKEIASRLVANLVDEKRFWPRFPVPTVALDDPHFDPEQMWRGPTWINVNYLLIEGLQRSGYPQLARQLRDRTLEMVSGLADICEYYNPKTGENPPRAAPIFGWSSAIFIELAIQATREAKDQ
jgi:putative isomerase